MASEVGCEPEEDAGQREATRLHIHWNMGIRACIHWNIEDSGLYTIIGKWGWPGCMQDAWGRGLDPSG